VSNLAESLNAEYNKTAEPLVIVDPVIPTQLRVKLTDISYYVGNPRSHSNPKFKEIKESINECGLKVPLVITRRPGSEKYIVASGGNTRLKILNELVDEGNKSFEHVNALFEPWQDDNNVLVSHLIENELRGEMCFVDTAKSICSLKRRIDHKKEKDISWREFERELKSFGLSYSHSQITRMRFLVEQLLENDIIPESKLENFGSHHTQLLQSAINDAKKHYTGELDFIDYFRASIQGFMLLFHNIDTVADSIRKLTMPEDVVVQPEPSSPNVSEPASRTESPSNVGGEPGTGSSATVVNTEQSSSPEPSQDGDIGYKAAVAEPQGGESATMDTGASSPSPVSGDNEVVQAEPRLKERLQQIINLRAENYELACLVGGGDQYVFVSDQGVGYHINVDVLVNTSFGLLHELSMPPYTINVHALSILSDDESTWLMNIFFNIHAQLKGYSLIQHDGWFEDLSNEQILKIQASLDEVDE